MKAELKKCKKKLNIIFLYQRTFLEFRSTFAMIRHIFIPGSKPVPEQKYFKYITYMP